jgi:flagellar hook-length control protein FliK
MPADRQSWELLTDQLKGQWTISPEDVEDREKVSELYRRLDRQMDALSRVLEESGQTSGAAYKAVSSVSQNIDFLQQLNQMFTYVQLTLRLQQGQANGDLYVYTNKRSLASGDGKISAFLHLDMEHLGPVDVYVALQDNKVSTKFSVRDDDMLDFLEEHMDILTKRLKKRGYDCEFSLKVRDEEKEAEEKDGGLWPVLQQETGIPLSRYSFDVRT